jgi:outer membrane protein assembly factor BamA
VGGLTLVEKKNGSETIEAVEVDDGTELTREWEQSLRSEYRNQAYAAGYPDAEISIRREEAATGSKETRVFDVVIVADWGAPVTFGGVRFEGDEDTRRSTLRRQLDLNKGEVLDRLEVAEARRKIMGLGIYQRVDLAFEPPTGEVRDAVYILEPGVRQELSLLVGWGSYEQLRAGFSWAHRNPFGRAHDYELEVKQSLKSSQAELGYFIPQIFGSDVLLYANAEFDDREEIDFQRSSRGVSVGTSYTTEGGLRLTAEYGFFKEDANRDDGTSFKSEEDAIVASLSFSARYDQRDNFLVPGSGWSVFSEFKIAHRWLGGSVDFQKLELGGSCHVPVSESTLLHLGLRGGAIITQSDAEKNIPFNERFFHGGENSVRGYQQGEASPLDPNGDAVGAETYALLNFELEQRVYSKLSLVLFSDTVLHLREGSLGGDGRVLNSVGFGLRYQTVIGPVRLEYGHNVNPRDPDPDGTLHISIGFPF